MELSPTRFELTIFNGNTENSLFKMSMKEELEKFSKVLKKLNNN